MTDNNRLLMELERKISEINREVINPVFPDMGVDDIKPVMESVAKIRAAYLNALFKIVEASQGGIPATEHIQKLRALRMTYEEMVSAAQALETAIQRDYMDVKM